MQELRLEEEVARPRDPAKERRERQRYWLLAGVSARAFRAEASPIPAREVGEALGLSREETFRLVLSLSHLGYLDYAGAGPRVRPTEKGLRYLARVARRRRSIREP